MPAEILIGSIEKGLAEAGITSAEVVSGDLWKLPREMNQPCVDEMVTGKGFPMVMVDDRVVCVDGIDVDAIIQELSIK